MEAINSSLVKIREVGLPVTVKNCTVVNTNITASSVWTLANSSYCVIGNITISGILATPTVLTIDPGVLVLVNDTTLISVGAYGSIRAIGTSDKPVLFTAASPIILDAGNWSGIDFGITVPTATESNFVVNALNGEALSETEGTTGSMFRYAVFEYATGPVNTEHSIWIDNSLFRENCNQDIYSNATTKWGIYKNNTHIHVAKTGCANSRDITIMQGNSSIKRNYFYFSYHNSYAGSSHFSSPGGPAHTLQDNIFDKSAAPYGGSIYCNGPGIFLRNNKFVQTAATQYGGALTLSNCKGIISSNTFQNTSAGSVNVPNSSYGGGAINILSTTANTTVLVEKNIFNGTYIQNSVAGQLRFGGAIKISNQCTGCTVDIMDNYFKNTYASSSGGAIYLSA